MDEIDGQLDLAIKTYPLAPLPAGFTRRLMTRIQLKQPSFRLNLLDLLLPGFFGIFGAGTVAAILLTVPMLDPLWLPRLRLAYQIFLVRLALMPDFMPYLMPIIVMAGIGLLAGILLAALIPGWTRTRAV